MIRTLTAMTYEVDDADMAVADILEGLNIESSLLANSVGILTCHMEFIREDVARRVSEALPFDVIGMNTLGTAAGGDYGQVALGVMVLTSGDLIFRTGLSAPLNPENMQAEIRELYRNVSCGERPSLIFALGPMVNDIVGDDYITYMDEASGGVMMFGSMAMDFGEWIRSPLTIYGGQAYSDRLCVLFIYGQVDPEFLVMSIPDDKILRQDAVITEASGNLLKKVNGLPAADYMMSIGLVSEEGVEAGQVMGVGTVPFAMYLEKDAPPVVRNVFGLTEDKDIICGGSMIEGAILGVGSVEYGDVIKTARQAAGEMLETGKKDGMIIFSCAGRNVALDLNVDDEANAVSGVIGKEAPFLFAYSGGEICPLPDENGRLKNRYHNNSIVLLAF